MTTVIQQLNGMRRQEGGRGRRSVMKVRNSLRSLKSKAGSVVVRRRGRLVVINRKNPRWNGRQG